MKKSLTIAIGTNFPFLRVGLHEQWDREVQPYLCVFFQTKTYSNRIFTLERNSNLK